MPYECVMDSSPSFEKDLLKHWKCNKDKNDTKHLLQDEQLSSSSGPQTQKETTWARYDRSLQNHEWSKGFNFVLSTPIYEVGTIIPRCKIQGWSKQKGMFLHGTKICSFSCLRKEFIWAQRQTGQTVGSRIHFRLLNNQTASDPPKFYSLKKSWTWQRT